jgi:hypothetical protein
MIDSIGTSKGGVMAEAAADARNCLKTLGIR